MGGATPQLTNLRRIRMVKGEGRIARRLVKAA